MNMESSQYRWKWKLLYFALAAIATVIVSEGEVNSKQLFGGTVLYFLIGSAFGLPIKGRKGLMIGLIAIVIAASAAWYGKTSYLS